MIKFFRYLSPKKHYSFLYNYAYLSTILPKRFLFTTSRLLSGEYEMQDPKSPDDIVNVTYIDKNGTEHKVKGKVGDNLMYLAHRYKIEIEGACEASLACSTCHVYVDPKFFDKLPAPEDAEEDMLDLAAFLRPTSRLSCQIILSHDLEGLTVTLPPATRNFYVDGHKPEPH